MAELHWLKLVRDGVAAWNHWAAAHRNASGVPAQIDLRSAHLANLSLCGADLEGVVLQGADLHGADLSRANLRAADLDWVNLTCATLAGADLGGARLRRARLVEADLKGSVLEGADASGANLNSAALAQSNLRNANLAHATLVGADLRGADLSGANLAWADVSFANIARALFQGAEFTPKGDPEGKASFLDLAMAQGIFSASFSPGFLEKYLSEAFDYAHRTGVPETNWGRYDLRALENVEAQKLLSAVVGAPPTSAPSPRRKKRRWAWRPPGTRYRRR